MNDKIIFSEELKSFSEKSLVEKIPKEGSYNVVIKGVDFYEKKEGPYDTPSWGIYDDTLYIFISYNKEIHVNLIRK